MTSAEQCECGHHWDRHEQETLLGGSCYPASGSCSCRQFRPADGRYVTAGQYRIPKEPLSFPEPPPMAEQLRDLIATVKRVEALASRYELGEYWEYHAAREIRAALRGDS